LTDFFIKNTPLPLPRPVMEELVPGSDNPGIKLDIPFPEMADIDLSFPLVGMNYIWSYWNMIDWNLVYSFGTMAAFIVGFTFMVTWPFR
jgi:hypothetical protein